MDVLEWLKMAAMFITGGGLAAFLVKAQKRNLDAKTNKLKADKDKTIIEAEMLKDESSLDILGESFSSLVKIYDAKFKAQRELFELRFETVNLKYEGLKNKMDEMEKTFLEKEAVYKVDIERLKIMDACAVEMKKCPNFPTCVGALLYHKLIAK